MKDLYSIARQINRRAHRYRMGGFQELRKKLHGLSRIPTRDIFAVQTIHDEWACHYGGRKELQFNIGFEGDADEWLRYGVAFSLKPSQTLPDVSVLVPKIHKLNAYLRATPREMEDLSFWYWQHGERSPTLPVEPIPSELMRVHTFLFWGSLTRREQTSVDQVLFLFDRLLPIYEYVEGNVRLRRRSSTDLRRGLRFRPGCPPKARTALGRSRAETREIDLRHNGLQSGVYKALKTQYGQRNVGSENDTGRGSRVDLVVRHNGKYRYYEIKTHPCIRACLREAISQLLEYSYWPGGNRAEMLVVVSENALTPDARQYLCLLRRKFQLPIYYQRFEASSCALGQLE